jgi:hypothetical protein
LPQHIFLFIIQSSLEYHLDAAIFFTVKDVVAVRGLIKIKTVRNHEGWVDLSLPNAVEQWA